MYFVYELVVCGRKYIGCTSDIRRRKDQHNENARKRASKLGVFLNENGIRLKVEDFHILHEIESRNEALAEERRIALELSHSGEQLLNDNYTIECTRKGKNLGNTSKSFVVIDCVLHKAIPVTDLRQYCLTEELNYKLLHRTCRSGHIYQNRYCVFYDDEWEKVKDKEKYLDGSFIYEVIKNARMSQAERTSKWYEVKFPDGHIETVKNLDGFAREHNLTSGTLHATYNKRKPTKGYQVIRRI